MWEEALERPEVRGALTLGRELALRDRTVTLATVRHRVAVLYVRLHGMHLLNDGCLVAYAFFSGYWDTVAARG